MPANPGNGSSSNDVSGNTVAILTMHSLLAGHAEDVVLRDGGFAQPAR